ncbi:hypothetical protein CUJ83_01290 [Methanocella sp. CWC-04]|uniref:Uncharacterized protein n=1 Tax=Methanooceanicella nereidis TaxID=2052831 RepID=A0AAP2R9Z3_9EURY|nr:hypothetical protein [Methanocella sp. CWC-04]MCD1293629.1 hypothetical protein [Methanocella sp. CWC-04]
MAIETHAIILDPGKDIINELHRNLREGNLLTKLDESSFKRVMIKNLTYMRIADPKETENGSNKSIWIEVTISF